MRIFVQFMLQQSMHTAFGILTVYDSCSDEHDLLHFLLYFIQQRL